uniref:Uncharacterized protein n=1 Tax=Panagrolaimus sp. PS1159 TaxID=55785 RepID=A0AC35FHC9_9BILA
MYEIGSTNPYGTSPNSSSSKSHEPYQKMVCQLTHSNNNLLHENERLSHRNKQLEMAMREQSELLNSIYYTLFRNGINTVAFPDGEEIHLSQFRGQLLTFGKANNTAASPRAPLQKTVNGFTGFTAVLRDRQQGSTGAVEKTSDFSSESSLSSNSVDQDELKAAMLKCITKTKYKNNDFDDFVNWLNDSGVQSARFEPDRKSRSLEEHMQESLRVRQPLQRSSRIEHARSESELVEGQRPSTEHSTPQSLLAIPESSRPSSTSGSLKTKALRHRAQSVAAGKINSFLGSRRTSSCIRQNTEPRNNSQRKSLANLASMRAASSSSNARQPRRNLI